MKRRFKHLFTMTFLLFFFCLCAHAVFGQPVRQDSLDRMIDFAGKELPKILQYIPVGMEQEYGFSDREEFKKTGLGLPYQEYDMDTGMPTGSWRLPVTVAGENRALLRLVSEDGNWRFAGFGGAWLARELGEFEKVVARKNSSHGRIVRDFRMYCDFVQYDRQPGKELEGLLHPLESAARVLLNAGITDRVGFGGYPLEKIMGLRKAFKKAPGGIGPVMK